MTIFTKQALANALKKLMNEKTLDKITVKELVESCGVNRQTFYYHFQDIYELLGWIYKTEALGAIKDSSTYSTWQQGLQIIFEYVLDNKLMCLNTCRSLGKDHLEKFLQDVLYNLLGKVFDEVADFNKLSDDDRNFILKFYCYGFSNILLEWIDEGMKTPYMNIVNNLSILMAGHFTEAVKRFKK